MYTSYEAKPLGLDLGRPGPETRQPLGIDDPGHEGLLLHVHWRQKRQRTFSGLVKLRLAYVRMIKDTVSRAPPGTAIRMGQSGPGFLVGKSPVEHCSTPSQTPLSLESLRALRSLHEWVLKLYHAVIVLHSSLMLL